MAVHTYRYSWVGVDVAIVNRHLDPLFPATFDGEAPTAFVDLTVDDSQKADLDEFMMRLGWIFLLADPASSPPTGVVTTLSAESELAVDASTSSTAFTNLLSVGPLVLDAAGALEIAATLATTATAAPGYARLLLDGIPLPNGGAGHDVGLGAHALIKRAAVAAGSHTVVLQWRTDAGGTLDCRPATRPDQEHASLAVRATNG